MKNPALSPDTQQSGEKLRALLNSRGIPAKVFAERMGITPQSLNNWFVRGVPAARLQDVNACFGRFMDEKQEGPASFDPEQEAWRVDPQRLYSNWLTVEDFEGDTCNLPIYGQAFFEENVFSRGVKASAYFPIHKDWLLQRGLGKAKLRKLGLAICKGQQMAPTLVEGDFLLYEGVYPGDSIFDGIYMVMLRTHCALRRIQILDTSRALLITDNKAYQAVEVDVKDIAPYARVHLSLSPKLV